MTLREVILDTETTGLDHARGDRVVEIGCIELVNTIPTGRTLHKYLNPQRFMPSAAQAVHGLTDEFLAKQPLFADVAADLLLFLDGAKVVAHNAEFDIGFLNAELARIGQPPLACEVIDTVRMARRRFPGAPANLDALCERFGIDKSARDKHGAMLDARLLADVYLELTGGRQPGLVLAIAAATAQVQLHREIRPPRPHQASDAEIAAHQAFLAGIKKAIWRAV